MKEFDFQKAKDGTPVETVDGRKARIICYDRKGLCPIMALIEDKDGEEFPRSYHPNGRFMQDSESGCDLVMAGDPGSGNDPVNSPKHYTSHPSGVECIQITEHYNFCIGNAIKYLWRHGLKESKGMSGNEKSIQDLEKAVWYINREIENLKKQ